MKEGVAAGRRGGAVRRPAAPSSAVAPDAWPRYVATIASVSAIRTPSHRWTASMVLAHSQPGAFLKETGTHDALRHVAVSLQYRF